MSMDAATAELLRGSLQALLASTSGAAVLAQLVELGWDEVVAEDAEASVGALFEEQGRARVASPALDRVVLDALAGACGPLDATTTAVVYPSPRSAAVPSSVATPAGGGHELEVDGMALAGADRAARLVVPVLLDGAAALAVVEAGRGLTARPFGAIDESAGWVALSGRTTVAPGHLVAGEAGAAAWATAVRHARRATGHELVGLADSILAVAVDHVTNRIQFGRPIGANQAVKHRLAEALVTITSAKAALHESWASNDPLVAAVARSIAGRAHADAAGHAQQVCGGIGFTWEFPLHHAVRRGFLLDTLLGSWRGQRASVGEQLLARGGVARLPVWR